MKFPSGSVKAVSVFFGQAHQRDFSARDKGEAIEFVKAHRLEDVIAIVWYRDEKPTKLYKQGRWADYVNHIEPPVFPKGRKPIGRGNDRYIAARLDAIVVALSKADEHQLKAIGQILAVDSTQKTG